MSTVKSSPFNLMELVHSLGPRFRERARAHDMEGRFVAENFRELRERRAMSAAVPAEFGGAGASYRELCEALRELAQYCGSTALAFSMHTHLVAAAVWRHLHGQPAEALLRKVADQQLVLVSTGACDWIDSVGSSERVPGGYRVRALKRFASGAPAGDLVVTSAPFDDPERGPEVLHFAVPTRAEGVRIHDDWDTLGMRGTGSHTIEFQDVFVPEEAVTLRRPRGQWHPVWSVVLTVAAPIYIAPYIGVAERAGQLAREAASTKASDPFTLAGLGEVENALALARMALRDMIDNANAYDFEPTPERANRALVGKTLPAKAAVTAVHKALEVVGGRGFYRRHELERLMRDIQGAPFHPLPERRQVVFTGRVALGLSPVG
jgi:alkylation response protein AidB-like acyl-CoA dehydrogenase